MLKIMEENIVKMAFLTHKTYLVLLKLERIILRIISNILKLISTNFILWTFYLEAFQIVQNILK